MKKTIQSELQVISRIILHANSSFDVLRYLKNDDVSDSPIIRQEKNMNDFFGFVRVNFYRITIIELCKLFNQKEDFSFEKLINDIKDKNLVNSEIFQDIEQDIEANKEAIKNIIQLRNKHYAHHDKRPSRIPELEIIQLEKLLTLAKSIFNKIHGELLEKTYYFDFPLGTPLHSLKKVMSKIEFFDENYKISEKNIQNFIK